ncbi:MAG TPA: heterodisulfide reductase-related iron-sulfur binding cluster [Bacteroidota bacterium]|nr:heterodisulfide reductase-related iron-sulfur binding cluster [Bacteroidota bacterium]
MSTQSLVILGVVAFSVSFFVLRVRRLITYLAIGKAENRFRSPFRRLANMIVVAFGQTKLFREPLAGLLHAAIFWGFLVLLLAIVESIGSGISASFSLAFLGPFYGPLAVMEEIAGFLVICSVLTALYRRVVTRPSRLDVHGHAQVDALMILSTILCIMVSMFFQNGVSVALGTAGAPHARFISSLLSLPFRGMETDSLVVWFRIFWWIHIGLVLAFLNYLPFSKHLHIVSSVPNVFFSKLDARGTLKPLNLQDETAVRFGAADVEDLTWKQLLDGYTCTECGRCTAACPAALTGKPLSPKKIIVDIRRRLLEKAPVFAAVTSAGQTGSEENPALQKIAGRRLVDSYITEDELWACTTCMACVQECPVQIEHVDAIVDMRRFLVLNESRFPKELQATFQNLERNFTPWAFSHASRADWAAGLAIPTMAEKPDAKILFWVGCAGAYDARYRRVTGAFAKLMKMAGIDFAILGAEEKCTGDPARRAGNEYLAQMLMNDNIATLARYNVRNIVTTCPHCFNILKNEYPALGGKYDVTHHTTFISRLIAEGRLRPARALDSVITYHDSCYIGRYNQTYDEPRDSLKAIPGVTLAEMPRSRDRGFCCGAGGARMFMEETTGKRVNIERTEEALSLQPDVIGTACPFCMTMMTDGVKAREAGDTVEVKDVAELVLEALEQNAPGGTAG